MTFKFPKFWAAKPKAEPLPVPAPPPQEAPIILISGAQSMAKFLSILKIIDASLQAELNVIPVTNKAGTILAIALVADHEVETFISAFQALRTPAAPATPAA
jgi:hypothetical protein